MDLTYTNAYRKAFAEYLRKGTPIRRLVKDQHATSHYVWRAQRDEKVRPSHRRNDGRVFSWADPPDIGHPGDGRNCRCEAVPYVEGQTEFGYHDFTTSLASSYDRWTDRDFVSHYYRGNGRATTLLEIGHLREIAEEYAFKTGTRGAFRRLSGQIASAARDQGPGAVVYDFDDSYDFRAVQFSHGGGTVRGIFVGVAEDSGDMLAIHGDSTFWFSDVFVDPLRIGVEPGGIPYPITGNWTASFSAEVFKDEGRSDFVDDGAP
jgi:SPP1 gp7 family putative phage head morphogenesis protein